MSGTFSNREILEKNLNIFRWEYLTIKLFNNQLTKFDQAFKNL